MLEGDQGSSPDGGASAQRSGSGEECRAPSPGPWAQTRWDVNCEPAVLAGAAERGRSRPHGSQKQPGTRSGSSATSPSCVLSVASRQL